MAPGGCTEDEQIAILRERVAKLEARLDASDRALVIATESRDKTKERVQNLVIGVIGIAITAAATAIGFLIHLSRGG